MYRSPELYIIYYISGNCGGSNAYPDVFVRVLTRAQSLTLALVIVTAALHLYILTRREHISFRTTLSRAPGSAVVFSLGIVVIWPLLALMSFHVRVGHSGLTCFLFINNNLCSQLLLLNITTIEQVLFSFSCCLLLFTGRDPQVRNKFHATLVPGPTPPNPFSLGRWYHNVAYLLCRPAGYTWIEASSLKMQDKRQINPGIYMELDETE